MIKITFLDGTDITINEETVIYGYTNFSDDPEKEFYLKEFYTNSINGNEGKKTSRLTTYDEKIGIMGFILSVDCFLIGEDTKNSILYRSTAVKSVENLDFYFD
ncbi:hypothetical protein E2R58_15195 [Paenibacillus amylolyticus]|uniref:hypothetical protein n=1 Tax=Paenibacillus amylolyticus TaxID=1451 RepID=UPI00105A3334|nr:hypothetical protein [Paenibacillus amylolyticus]TDL70424.1 hypothetical protein E2R58_15195 [Paenibacillus amylolyticus]